jgi:hypothetical protein
VFDDGSSDVEMFKFDDGSTMGVMSVMMGVMLTVFDDVLH